MRVIVHYYKISTADLVNALSVHVLRAAILVMYFTAQRGDGLSLDDDSATVYIRSVTLLANYCTIVHCCQK